MIIGFKLTMPNNNSWNGKWSGAGKQYYVFRNITKDQDKRLLYKMNTNLKNFKSFTGGCNFYYNFGDGWGANIKAERIESREKQRLKKLSAGFCGYEWMVDSILKHGKIIID